MGKDGILHYKLHRQGVLNMNAAGIDVPHDEAY